MEAEDDNMIVLVVVDDDERAKNSCEEDHSPPEAFTEVNDLIETARKHGQYISIKLEPQDEDQDQCDYLEDEMISETVLKKEVKEEPIDNTENDNDEDYVPDADEYNQSEELDSSRRTKKPGFSTLKPWQQHSFVAELRQEYEELREDEGLLIDTLEQIMRTVKAPPPPQDYYIMNGIMFECVNCGFLMDSIPATCRHYQEKHGQRYLMCYACGVDFRSTTNLYKHEKRCVAPDAVLVLKARAAFLGRKGRSRPYLAKNKFSTKQNNKFPCQLCSAVFITKSNLESHENLHRGIRPYRCDSCPCAYTSYSALSRHAKKHTDIQFICDHCNRSFKIKAALVAHMDTHKPMRKHGCDECSRRFAQKSALILHVNRVHRNLPPPCACQICPKRYPRWSLLKAHMKRAHGMSIITRKMFFKTLPTMTELEMKESKVIHKYEEDDLDLDFVRPIKTEKVKIKEEENIKKYEESYSEATIDFEEETPMGDMSVDDFMQYVTQNDQDIGTNVIYIENGEVVQTANNDDIGNNLLLEVEAIVDGQILVKTLPEMQDPGIVQNDF